MTGKSEFREIFKSIEERTLVTENRCYMIYQLLRQTQYIDGDVAELGVYKGGTAMLMARTTDKKIHLFDTFTGIPHSEEGVDIHKEGDFGDTSLEEVKEYLKEFNNIRFYQGVFPFSAKELWYKAFSFVHIDVDVKRSIRDGLEFFYPKMKSEGIIVIDDYGRDDCPGVEQAVDSFFKRKAEVVIELPDYQCFIVKM